MKFKSEVVEVADGQAAVELFFERKWTDGLPVVPPTEEAVAKMIDYVKRDPQEVLGEIPPYGGIATIEKLAINSVMAGCLPEYFPVVIAAVEEIFWRGFLYRWMQKRDFLSVDPGALDLTMLLAVSVIFGFEHDRWFVGIIAGLAYGWLYVKTKDLWSAILAHVVTNLLLGSTVLVTGQYGFW